MADAASATHALQRMPDSLVGIFVAWLLRRTATKLVTAALAYASYVVAPI